MAAASSTNTQSGSPALLLPGDVKLCVPVFENGEPAIAVNVFALGSNHRAVIPFWSLLMATLIVPPCGRYAIPSDPSAVTAAVT